MEEKAREMIEEFENLGTKFEAVILTKGQNEEYESELKSKMMGYEISTKEVVNSETDENGKKKYSNEELRNIAVYKILSTDEEYQKLKKSLEETQKDIQSNKYQAEVLKTQIGIKKAQAELVVALLKKDMGE
jgi:2-iminoacetate synthase ThiH